MVTVTERMTGLKGFVMYSMKKSLLVYLAFYCTKLERGHNLVQVLIPRAGPSFPDKEHHEFSETSSPSADLFGSDKNL